MVALPGHYRNDWECRCIPEFFLDIGDSFGGSGLGFELLVQLAVSS